MISMHIVLVNTRQGPRFAETLTPPGSEGRDATPEVQTNVKFEIVM
jgi:hypothetical protein